MSFIHPVSGTPPGWSFARIAHSVMASSNAPNGGFRSRDLHLNWTPPITVERREFVTCRKLNVTELAVVCRADVQKRKPKPDFPQGHAVRIVSDGFSPNRLRYASAKRPKCEKPHASAIDETLSVGDAHSNASRADLSLASARNWSGVYPRCLRNAVKSALRLQLHSATTSEIVIGVVATEER